MMSFIRILLLLNVFTFCNILSAQVSISGQIINVNNEGIPNINIIFYEAGSNISVAFAVSSSNGDFKANIVADSDSLDILLSSVHYRNEIRRVPNLSQELTFNLVTEVMELESITVKASPIEQKGDTITYLVSSFAKQEDRSIEDVLRRMPGIEIETGGRILYQGLPLQKFYVEGLDLMDGRYVVVSENLPLTSVSSVEILENHQPVRIYENKIPSNQASLNIKLKRDITATGIAELGAGLTPFLRKVNITPMIFMKNIQLLISYQSNNIGDDVSRQLHKNTLRDLLNQLDRPSEKPELTDINIMPPPKVEKYRYLNNNIHLLNMNGLVRLTNKMQIRANLYYIKDIQRQESKVKHTHFTPNDTIAYQEFYNNQMNDNYLNGKLSLNRNVRENFLNNELEFKVKWDQIKSNVLNDNRNIFQELDNPFLFLSNLLQSINPIGEYLMEFESYISIDNNSNELSVKPGQFENVLNDGLPYSESLQSIYLNRFYTNNSARIVLNWQRITFTPRIGFSYRDQSLESENYVVDNDSLRNSGPSFSNNLGGKYLKMYAKSGVEYINRRINITANFPLSWQDVKLKDSQLSESQEYTAVFFDPGISISYEIKGFWKIRGAWSYKNLLGDMDKVHYAYILKNYRTLSQNNTPISLTKRNNYSAYLSYRNPITSFFNSLTYVYFVSNNSLLYSSIIQENGTSLIKAYEIPNKAYYHSIQFHTSKFLSNIKTNISFGVNFNQRNGLSLLNKQIFNTRTLFYSIAPEIDFTITHWLNAEYCLHANNIKTFLGEGVKSNIFTFKHQFDIFAYPWRHHMLRFSFEYYSLNNSNNYFLDISYRFTLKKQKLDFELFWNNIFNNVSYISYFANSYTVTESIYYLRPRQVFFSVKFSI